MARAPDERAEKAFKLYQQGFKLIEIARQLEVPEGTVRSWKNKKPGGFDISKKGGQTHAQRNDGYKF